MPNCVPGRFGPRTCIGDVLECGSSGGVIRTIMRLLVGDEYRSVIDVRLSSHSWCLRMITVEEELGGGFVDRRKKARPEDATIARSRAECFLKAALLACCITSATYQNLRPQDSGH